MCAPLAARADVRGIRAGGRVSANRSGAAHAVWNSVRGATAGIPTSCVCRGCPWRPARHCRHRLCGGLGLVVDRSPGRSISICVPRAVRLSVDGAARRSHVSTTAWVKWALVVAERAARSLSGAAPGRS